MSGNQIIANLWFDTEAEEAANYYIDVFGNGQINHVAHYTENAPREEGMVMVVEWEVNGTRFVGINGGPDFKFDEAISFQIDCHSQDEVDHYWSALAEGGEEGPCGWLKDRYGLSWQIVPRALQELLADPDRDKAQRVMAAMMQMGKIEVAGLERAAEAA